MKTREGLVAADKPFRVLNSSVRAIEPEPESSSSKEISQLPVQFPDGQSDAPTAEQLPAQLAPSPQVASSIVLFKWQQFTITDWLEKVNAFSKKSIVVAFEFPEV